VLRLGVLLISAMSFASVTPCLAQSMKAQEYYFNSVENAWKPLPARELPKATEDTELVKLMTLQEYHFNSADNAWEPLAAPRSAVRISKEN
jgi:hypothetical protein